MGFLHQSLCKLGLRFKNSDMEVSYQKFQAEMEHKLINAANILSVFLSGLNLLLGLIGSRELIPFRIAVLITSIIGAVIRHKCHFASKVILIFTSLGSFYVTINSFAKFVNVWSPESYYLVGNVFGLAELIFTLSFGNLNFKVSYSLIHFVVKLIMLRDGLLGRVPIRFIGMTILYIIFYIYYVSRERKIYKSIYESREQLKKFQSLLSNDFPSSVLIMSSDFSSILYSNHFFKDKFGADDDQRFILSTLNKFNLDNFPASLGMDNHIIQNLHDFVQNVSKKKIGLQGKEVVTLSATFESSDINTLHYEIKIRQIKWDSELCYALIFNDVSDKQLIMALKIADEHKDRIIATVSHELRTPINGIMGLIEIISSRVIDKVSRTYLDHCKSCSKLLLYLVNSILDLSQIRHKQLKILKTSFNLEAFLEELRSLYLFQSQEKDIEFVIKKDQNIPVDICTDKYRLIEVLINLLGNAFKFTSKGKITLTVSKVNEFPDQIMFSVDDTGVGIKEIDKPKLFTMFGKLTQEDKNINAHGVGLGLTIANELVKVLNNNDSNAKIDFESEYGKGTKFYFKICLNQSSNQLTQSDNEQGFSFYDEFKSNSEVTIKNMQNRIKTCNSSLMTNSKINLEKASAFLNKTGLQEELLCFPSCKKSILIVDDNPFNILAASFVLEKLKFNVKKAMSGEECIQILEEDAKRQIFYDLILMDIQMPIMDGLETSKLINKKIETGELYYLPIISLTAGEINKKDLKEYQQCGIIDCLSKPLKEQEIDKALNKWLETHLIK